MDSRWRHFFWKLSLMSPLTWGIILLILAFILTRFGSDFLNKVAIFPTVVAFFLLYQAIFKGKM